MITRGYAIVALCLHVLQELVWLKDKNPLPSCCFVSHNYLDNFCVTVYRTTVCNAVGSSLKAVDVKTEDASEDVAHLDAFCVKDKGQ